MKDNLILSDELPTTLKVLFQHCVELNLALTADFFSFGHFPEELTAKKAQNAAIKLKSPNFVQKVFLQLDRTQCAAPSICSNIPQTALWTPMILLMYY
jgi:hypothetical protein